MYVSRIYIYRIAPTYTRKIYPQDIRYSCIHALLYFYLPKCHTHFYKWRTLRSIIPTHVRHQQRQFHFFSPLSLSLAVYISFSLPLCLTRDQFNKLYRKYWLLNTLEQITGLCKKRGRRKMMVENYKLICIFIIVTLGWLAIYVNNKKKNEKKFARKNKIRSRYVWGTIYKCSRVFLHSQLSLWILIYLCILFAAYTFACVWQKAEVSALFVLAHGQQ